ncbi:hypothetical protein HYFRA_00002426 [Hymenoscyphus fraxineus]|uniref:Folic acid synthesis protein FOL1 n=1 Tax=Hymenoscyphus fraxineus TaxID=746836 RepID=A0A9N9PNI9_9HELO|nr:hypothetical protein HYFRA_00002426 [Hymenoscyphus fraxineus]
MKTSVTRSLARVNTLACNHAAVRRRPTSAAFLRTTKAPFRCQSSSSKDDEDVQKEDKGHSWAPHPMIRTSLLDNLPEVVATGKNWRTAYIALGSNLSNRVDWIERALREMKKKKVIRLLRTSSLWETDPMYVLEQDKFLNGVCEISTSLEPIELLDTLQEIENDLGRMKTVDKGPRNIDLDILMYDNQVINEDRLTIPHPLIAEREFVLRPLSELIPAQPLTPASPWKTVQDHLNALPPSTITTVTPLDNKGKEFLRPLQPTRSTRIMAILNMTPDSFSDGGKNDHLSLDPAELEKTMNLLTNRGATIIDIGGQSTAPNAFQISDAEEASRVIPIVEMLRDVVRFKGLISVDTYRSSVARVAIKAGANIINDISAGELDRYMLPTLASLHNQKTVCLMHMRGTPNTMQNDRMTAYPDGLIPTIAKELLERLKAAEEAGIYRWRIILDPGIGFAKNATHALEILRRLDELREWPGLVGLPWLVGASRKKFIGRLLAQDRLTHATERIYGTAGAVAASVKGGADIVRVHDVRQMKEVATICDAIWRVQD